jgi:hypothetical protein
VQFCCSTLSPGVAAFAINERHQRLNLLTGWAAAVLPRTALRLSSVTTNPPQGPSRKPMTATATLLVRFRAPRRIMADVLSGGVVTEEKHPAKDVVRPQPSADLSQGLGPQGEVSFSRRAVQRFGPFSPFTWQASSRKGPEADDRRCQCHRIWVGVARQGWWK